MSSSEDSKYLASLQEDVADLQKRVLALERSSGNISESSRDALKESIKSFMLKHFNISFVRDDIEADVYDALVDGIFDLVPGL